MHLHYNVVNSYLFINGKEAFQCQADNRNVNFSTQVILGSISNGFSALDFREVSLDGNGYGFLVDFNSINKSSILNIQKYLMINNSI